MEIETKDSNWNILERWDTVIITQNINVKNSSMKIKSWTKVKNINLIDDDPDNIEWKIDGTMMVIKTIYIKKDKKKKKKK